MNFLHLGPRAAAGGAEPAADLPNVPQAAQTKYSFDKELADKINSIEKRLFKQNFSYSSCVWEKIDASKDQQQTQSANSSSVDGNNGGEGNGNETGEEVLERKHSVNKGEGTNQHIHREGSQNGSPAEQNGANIDEDAENEGVPLTVKGQQQSNVAMQQAEALNQQDRDSNDPINAEDAEGSFGDSFTDIIGSGTSSKDSLNKVMRYLSQEYEQTPQENNEFLTFFPRPTPNSKLFFGGSNFYVCFRFYYTMFERLLKAYELAMEIPENELTMHLTPQEKAQLGEERYDTFKEILKLYIKEPFESATFEDCLRCIYGRDAGFLFSIDKIVNNIIKNIPAQNDPLSAFVFEHSKEIFDLALPGEDSDAPEIIKYGKVCQKLREMQEEKGNKTSQTSAITNNSANILRYYYDPERRQVHINIAQSLYHKWNQKSVKSTKKHFDLLSLDRRHHPILQQPILDHTRSAQRPSNHHNSVIVQTHPANRTHAWESIIYLSRNRKTSTLKGLHPDDVLIRNRVSYKVSVLFDTDPT